MLKQVRFLVLVLILIARGALAAEPAQVGLYLSYEQRLALTYMLLAQGEPEEKQEQIIERAKSQLKAMYETPVKTVQVSNFDEFLRLFKGDWPDTHSVELDMEILEKRGLRGMMIFEAKSPRIQKQIDRYMEWQQEKVQAMMNSKNLDSKYDLVKLGQQFMPLLHTQEGQTLAAKWALQQGEELLNQEIKELDRVGEKMAKSGFGHQQDPTVRIFMQTMFSEYFSRLSLNSKKLIVSSFLGGDLLASDIKKFEIMVQNSGPQLQKLLQVVARQADVGPEMLEIFRALENSVRPVPWVQVEDIVNKERENFKFTYFERKPLGVGTMAQVHRAKILVDGKRQDVVVRFIKPGIEARVQEDKMILTEVANILDNNPEFRKTGTPKLAPIIDDITKTVTAELSQADTINRQKIAKTRYDKRVIIRANNLTTHIEFNVPRIFDGAHESNLMVQEMVIGKKVDKEVALYQEVTPGLKKAVIESLARLWANEVLFGGGFYHSDLHQGNFMLYVTDPKIRLHILDFGMGGEISEYMQRQVMLLGAGTELLNPDSITKALWNLSEKEMNTISETQFKQVVTEYAERVRLGKEAPMTIERWTALALDQGLKLPYEFVSLNRGLVIVNKLLADAGSDLNVNKLMKEYARSHPAMIYYKLVLKEGMPHKDLIKLGWGEVRAKLPDFTIKMPFKSSTVRCEAVFM